jgi:anti-sigma regulatory factor (Ser/Thr protein kinase)
VTKQTASDAALVVSELVTNSVQHADLGAEDTVLVELTLDVGRLAITVTDPGSDLVPRLLAPDPTTPRGFGLHLVDNVSTSWGVHRNPGALQVWCEFALGEPGPERCEVQAAELSGHEAATPALG